MIRINQLKITLAEMESRISKKEEVPALEQKLLHKKLAKLFQISETDISCSIVKKSIDARKEIKYIYSVEISKESLKKAGVKPQVLSRLLKSADILEVNEIPVPEINVSALAPKCLVTGSGPAGLFCAYTLAKAGVCPILIERGAPVEERIQKVETFWNEGILDLQTNIQFGEGGAGTFSDGKLNTMVKDKTGLNFSVLSTFVAHGAPAEILYLNKPHIGTDHLTTVVKNIRESILSAGGTVMFHTQLTDFTEKDGRLTSVTVTKTTKEGSIQTEEIPCDALILAPGHSARDTFLLLKEKKVPMEQKAFAIGVRAEHLQEEIDRNQYKGSRSPLLPASDYKLTYQAKNRRSVYSFCMCPGGYVVNASSEAGHTVVNGMSYYRRDSKNANSAIVVSVTPEDFPDHDVLAGVSFQRKWESLAYREGNGAIPIQLYRDFKENKKSEGYGRITSVTKGNCCFANIRNCLPDEISNTLIEGMEAFGGRIKGFSNDDVVFSGVETRTSSPVRILRDETGQSSIKGLYPCGEGAGYAGGITSAAMDGIRIAQMILKGNKP